MNGLSSLLLVHLHEIHDDRGGYAWEVLGSPFEIRNLFEFGWILSRRSSYVVLYIPRVKDGMYVGESV